MSALDGQRRSATVVTQEPSVLFWLTCADFWEVLWEMPPISYNLVRSLSQRTRVLTAQVQAISSLDVQGRLARQLIILAQEYGRPYPAKGAAAQLIPFQLKQAEIAAMIGATREQVNQLLSAWLRRDFRDDSARRNFGRSRSPRRILEINGRNSGTQARGGRRKRFDFRFAQICANAFAER